MKNTPPTNVPKPPEGAQQRVADAITAFSGSMVFVYVHIVIFAVWIGVRGFGHDEYPFNFLTMAVSLEAIFLSTFILISQNRQQAVAEEYNHRTQETLLRMVDGIVDDEKLDQANENMIKLLVQRIDTDRIQPMQQQLTELAATLARIEGRAAAG